MARAKGSNLGLPPGVPVCHRNNKFTRHLTKKNPGSIIVNHPTYTQQSRDRAWANLSIEHNRQMYAFQKSKTWPIRET